ncbi:MAG: DUF4178 domain-containing protein [Pyrinomonadaceae bacterium]|nr:DUF4178 domain-containing protein [Pyrinomonadaceae bacterium]
MSFLQANCPSCAAPLEFQKGSTIVVVCPSCRSAVARTDRALEDLCKVAEIVDSQSPLKLGLRGEFGGNKFTLTGRAQLRHELGGFWDEWYAVFSNGWVGWLAEAQGRFYLTFHQPLPAGIALPPFQTIRISQTISEIPSQTPLLVAEKGTATHVAAEGEIPFKLTPGEPKHFADLSGINNAFGSIDYSANPARVFVGRQVTLGEIGLGDAKPVVRAARQAQAAALGCPNCGGALELIAPDKTERVTCPFCNSLLDVNQGNFKFLKSLDDKNVFTFELPIGAKGAFEMFEGGAEMQIIGAMVRSVTYDDTKYFWKEYLLYNPMIGFRWLVESDTHWSFVEPVNVAEVEVIFAAATAASSITETNPSSGNTVTFQDKTFHLFQTAPATVEYVKGEFYWRVEQGETVNTADYVHAPQMLSMESTDQELNWSLGTYVNRETVRKTFAARSLPELFIVAPNQPFTHNALIRASLVVLAAFVLVAALVSSFAVRSEKRVTGTLQRFTLAPQIAADSKTIVFTAPFYLTKGKNALATIKTDLNYESWSEFSATLVPANTSENQINQSQVKTGEYSYRDWTSKYERFDIEATGEYQLRLEGNWKEWGFPLNLEIDVNQPSRSGFPVVLLLIFMLGSVPLILLIYKYNFESRRWSKTDAPQPLGGTLAGIFSGK